MSSIGVILSTKPGDYTFTEADWNHESEAVVAKLGKEAGFNVYLASKAAAERAVWEFRDQHKPKFSLAAINPCFVTGPSVIPVSSPKASVQGTPGFVDIRDVARAVVFGVENPDRVDGERFILAAFYEAAWLHAENWWFK
ncbi:hypothetical protein B0T26DRAFT_755131 [Lasiosphaeria miniovina]|uniref:Uncharacterized protein n=1 Tax=Lasiosphaeria miniovina TaxID=1954250 RepID=A0AA40A6A5_9PEZI|nr:uncharacterized protein B0T26DRAFT_755131 [Lasiosphaeria miniovina]KAK0710010.1 hypothetical protein B0T26DRAFT_755131 [Lasiosphaeria miniovina]